MVEATNQEKIREGLKQFNFVMEEDRDKPNPVTYKFYDRLVDELLKYLDLEGAAIKVEGELPKPPIIKANGKVAFYAGYQRAQEDMAGYVATEPLIKEEK